jgi:hypothetical protein
VREIEGILEQYYVLFSEDPRPQTQSWAHPASYLTETIDYFPPSSRGYIARDVKQNISLSSCAEANVELFFHSSIRFHGVVFNLSKLVRLFKVVVTPPVLCEVQSRSETTLTDRTLKYLKLSMCVIN